MTADISIEPAADHLDLISTVAHWYWTEWGKAVGRLLASETARLMERASPDRIPITWLALDRGQPVGAVMLIEHDMPNQSDLGALTPWLAGLYVRPSHRELGIATALICRCEAGARQLGIRRLYPYTWTARALFQRLRWRDHAERRHRGRVVEIMSKDLAPLKNA